jgi:ABC-2 type transport system permease protein
MSIMPTLIRRELWEHRSLWVVPLVIGGLIVAAAMFPHADLQIDSADVATPQKYMDLFALFHSALTIPQFLLLALLLPYYLLDCLYAERKDRSILFWKALPVSDAQTVLSKLLVALVIVPLGVFVLTLFTDIAASGILAVRLRNSQMVRAFLSWDTEVWLHTQGLILAALVMVMLWYAPIAGYLLLVSAWAKRGAFLWAAMPPLVAMLIEKIAFGTTHVVKLLGYRLNGIWGALGFTHDAADTGAAGGEHAAGMLDRVTPLAALENIDLWLGLAVTVAFVWLTIRMRRHQDDS